MRMRLLANPNAAVVKLIPSLKGYLRHKTILCYKVAVDV